MGVATLELRPGHGLGPFSLGMVLCDALAQVQQQSSLFESTHIKYSDQEPLLWDIVVAFPHLGFHLCFDPSFQRLHRIEVYDISRLHMRYANAVIGGPSTPPTFARIYAMLGPTFPGSFDPNRSVYSLHYPGLSLSFPIPPHYAHFCMQQKELPLEFSDGTTPVVNRICLHLGEADPGNRAQQLADADDSQSSSSTLAPLALKYPPLMLPHGSQYMEEVVAELGSGICLVGGGQRVPFGASAQDVWSELGRPCCISQKQVETMLIHSPSPSTSTSTSSTSLPSAPAASLRNGSNGSNGSFAASSSGSGSGNSSSSSSYVYSYFLRGFDVVFDAESHGVRKFVLHTNQPGHVNFNKYLKCNFLLLLPSDENAGGDAAAEWAGGSEGRGTSFFAADRNGTSNGNGRRHERQNGNGPRNQSRNQSRNEREPPREQREAFRVTADSRWDDVQMVLGDAGQAAIQTSGPLHAAFGPTFVYGLKDAAFEVMRNGHICTVTLFQSSTMVA